MIAAMKNQTSQLRSYERHTACLLSGLLAGLGLFVVIQGRNISVGVGETIRVHVVGAVRETDVMLPLGATLDDVLTRIELLDGAEPTNLDGQRRMNNGEIVVIPYGGTTTVYVTGAVKEAKVVVLDDMAKPKQVLECVDLQNDADISMFLRRRTVRNGSVIEIKKKKKSFQKEVLPK